MKVLFLCSGHFAYSFKVSQVFIYELSEALKTLGVEIDVFLIKERGYLGYLKALFSLWRKLIQKKYNLVHAFYGLSGLVACLQFISPVIVTFLGSDVQNKKIRYFSKIANRIAHFSIFVEKSMVDKLNTKKKFVVLPFGLNNEIFKPIDKSKARSLLGYSSDDIIIIFSSAFNNKAKNYPLAKKAIELTGLDVSLIELGKNYSREDLAVMYNASDIFLLTSFAEGSPQTVKEAMACNCPIVATDVGDIKEITKDIDGCFITSFEPSDVAEKIKLAIQFSRSTGRTNCRERIINLDNKIIASKIYNIYKTVSKNDL